MTSTNGTVDDATILVTGGCGYLGSQFIRDLGATSRPGTPTVRILDNFQRETHTSLLNLPEGARYEFVEGDILDPTAVDQALQGVDVVVHLAALVTTPFSHEHPEWTDHVNHWGTVRLLQDCMEAGVGRFVLAGSASVLGPGGPFDETSDPQLTNPYTRSKWEAEKAVRDAARSLETTILRFGTIYGGHCPGLRFDAIPNRLVFQAATGQTTNLSAPRQQIWPYIHVEDASQAIIHMLPGSPGKKTLYHAVGSNVELEAIADGIRDLIPEAAIRFGDTGATSIFSSHVAADRLRDSGWSPAWSFSEGLEDLVEHLGDFDRHVPRPEGPLA